MFQVVWLQTALEELATVWALADSEGRKAFTAAAHNIDLRLKANPHEQGESRDEGERIFFASPLGITFEIKDQYSIVRVLHVWDIRRHQ